MDHQFAEQAIRRLREGVSRVPISFVRPILATMFAAEALREGSSGWRERIDFSTDAGRYSENLGLAPALRGEYEFPPRGGRHGVSYSKLTKLALPAEVDACNAVVNDLIDEQLRHFSPKVASHLAKVVGELHDNVASHAGGAGFSAVQVYEDPIGKRVEFAIADVGCGMLHNVRQVVPGIAKDADAVQWCLVQGNTSAKRHDPMAQRLPDDVVCNPFPSSVDTYSVEDHHVGEGLWRLCLLISAVQGSVWIKSGNGAVTKSGTQESCSSSNSPWRGVAIEVELKIPFGATISEAREERIAELGERLGL
ncbi:MAG: hypothetical protein WD066_09310 [Planctomycetaceae bacterium]